MFFRLKEEKETSKQHIMMKSSPCLLGKYIYATFELKQQTFFINIFEYFWLLLQHFPSHFIFHVIVVLFCFKLVFQLFFVKTFWHSSFFLNELFFILIWVSNYEKCYLKLIKLIKTIIFLAKTNVASCRSYYFMCLLRENDWVSDCYKP